MLKTYTPASLSDVIHELSKEISTHKIKLEGTFKSLDKAKRNESVMYEKLSFGDKFFCWLSKESKLRYQAYRAVFDEVNIIDQRADYVEEFIGKLTDSRHQFAKDLLKMESEEFLAHQVRYDAAGELTELTQEALRFIGNAISAIESAETTEILDMVSDNKGLSLLSSINTSDASNAVKRMNAHLESYQKQITEKLPLIQPAESLSEIDSVDFSLFVEISDLIFDFVFTSSFDVLSFLSYLQLGDAKSAITNVHIKVGEFKGQLAILLDEEGKWLEDKINKRIIDLSR